MRHIIPAMLAVAISFIPLGARADEPPAPAPGGMGACMRQDLTAAQSQQMQQIMQQTHQQMAQIFAQARTRALGALTPANRQRLANVAGQLAIAPNPDVNAAAAQLDASLSPAEAQAIVAAHAGAMTQMRSAMEAAHQKMEGILTPAQRTRSGMAGHEMGHMMGQPGMGGMPQPSAGHILLHLSSAAEDHPGRMMMMMMDHGH